MKYKEFGYWIQSMIKVERCILHRADNDKGYIIAWDDINLDNINKENWV